MIRKLIEKYKILPIQIKASLWFLLCSFLQKGIAAISTPIFTRLMTTEEYGQYNLFSSWMSILTVFVTLDLSGGLFAQGLVKFEEDKAKFASSMQGLNFTLTSGWTAVYLLFQDMWNAIFGMTTMQMLAMLLIIWATNVYQFWAAEQRNAYNYKTLVLLSVIVAFVKPTVEITLVYFADEKVLARIIGMTIVEILAYAGLFFVQLFRGKQFYSKRYWLYAVTFNLPLIPHYLSQMVLSLSDRIIIGKLVGDSEAGIYSLAYSIALLITIFSVALQGTLDPWIYQKIKAKRFKDIEEIGYIVMPLMAGVNLMLIAFAPEVVAVFAPAEYYDAIWVIPPVAMGVFFMFCYDFFAKFQFYYEKTKYIMVASVVGAILNVVLNYMFIPVFGFYAAAYTTLVCYIVYVVAHFRFMRKVCKEKLEGICVFSEGKLLLMSSVFMLCGFGLMLTYKSIVVRYLLIGIAIVVLVLYRKRLWNKVKVILEVKKNGEAEDE